MLAHLLSIPSWLISLPFLGPLVVFLIYKDRSLFVREHAAEALNMAISVFLYTMALFFGLMVLGMVTLGFGFLLFWLFLLPPIAGAVCSVLASLAANRGQPYRYPLIVRFVR